MSVEVRIPTILRTFTGGEKAVHGDGATLQEVLDDIDARNPGLKERIVESETLRRFVNVYVNDEDVRFSRRPQGPYSRWRRRRGAARRRRRLIGIVDGPLRLAWRVGRSYPAGRAAAAVAERIRAALGKAGGLQPHRLDQGSGGAAHDQGRRSRRDAATRSNDPGTYQRQHRHLARDGGEARRLPADLRDAGEHLSRAQADARRSGVPRSSPHRRKADPTRRSASPSSLLPSIRTG